MSNWRDAGLWQRSGRNGCLGARADPVQGGCFVPLGLEGWIWDCEGPYILMHPMGAPLRALPHCSGGQTARGYDDI